MVPAFRAPLALAAVLSLLCACPGEETSGGGTETDMGTSTSSGESTADPDSTGADASGTGEPAGTQLVPCDPLIEEACEEGICAGHPMAGFYCRPSCSSMAEPGTPCGSDDQCLPVQPGAEQTACFDLRECEPATGAGCMVEAGDSCVVVGLDPLLTSCVPAADAGAGQACTAAGILDCGPGFGCLGADVEAGIDGECTGWCEVSGALPPGCVGCVEVVPGLGTCAECSVADDDCPAGTQCQLANELLGGACIEVGAGGPGAPCAPLDPANSCLDGLLCVPFEGDQPICLPACDPSNPMCLGEGESCVDLDLLVPGAPPDAAGVCLDVGLALCDPMAEPSGCAEGENCLDIGGGLGICGAICDPVMGDTACEGNAACFPTDGSAVNGAPFAEGNGACGADCITDAQCGGGTCLHLDGLTVDGLCGTTCTPGAPGGCGAGEGCVATPEDPAVGACMPFGNPCTLGNLGECGGGLACIPMEGRLQFGICLPSCFAHNPVACGGMPTTCHPKTDPLWHEGTCVGSDPPCSLIADDCGPGQACSVVGGGPIGGQAFLCDDAGPLGEGDDCSMDEEGCGAGVGCFGGVCAAWCDPLADACVTGTCTDVGIGFYLPPNTIGACL